MAYSKEIYEKALNEINKRREAAEITAEKRKKELYKECPDIQYIDFELAKTGYKLASALGAKPEEVEAIISSVKKENDALKKEKQKIFKAMKLPEDYLDVHYTCTKCNDTGFYEIRDEENGVSHGTKLCSCHIDLLKRLAAEEMAAQTPLELSTFEDFDLNFYKDDKMQYYKMQGIYENSILYAKGFSLDSPNLFFHGRTGLGKTHLSLSIANEVIKKGYNVVYGSVNRFFAKIETEKFGRNNDTYTLDTLCSADLLILDDLGMEFATSFTNSVLYTIIDTRICKGLPTIISSNLSLDELRDKYHESIVSRIIGTYEALEFLGKDVRQSSN